MKFPLHAYLRSLRDAGATEAFIDIIHKHARPLASANLPVILTLGHLSFASNAPKGLLSGIINRQIDPYRVFAIRKRSGGKRYICVPEAGLLSVQRWIHQEILCSAAALKHISDQTSAYAPGKSHILNAQQHLGATWVIKVDIARFFESISERQVYKVFTLLGYRPQVAFFLTRVCTRILPVEQDLRRKQNTKRWQTGRRRKHFNNRIAGHLPQGAPTSPMLANLVCKELDEQLEALAIEKKLTYTRYADDIVFTGEMESRENALLLTKEISQIIQEHGFDLNHQKTSIAKNGSRKIVTGISISDCVVRIPRPYKDKIRQELYYLDKFGLSEHCKNIGQNNHLPYLLRLAGRIKYVASVEPEAGRIFSKKFKSIFPSLDELEAMLA